MANVRKVKKIFKKSNQTLLKYNSKFWNIRQFYWNFLTLRTKLYYYCVLYDGDGVVGK